MTISVEPAAVTTVGSSAPKVLLRQRKWALIRLASPIVLLAVGCGGGSKRRRTRRYDTVLTSLYLTRS